MEVTTLRYKVGGANAVATTVALKDEADVRDHIDAFFGALDAFSDDIEEGRDVISVSITVVRRDALN
jgi:hypothetical protein